MKTSEAFKLTLKYLRGYAECEDYSLTSRFICNASYSAGVEHIVKPIMAKLLDDCVCYEHWIQKNCNIKPHVVESDFKKLQYSRKLWIEHLIQHYESIGD